MPKLGGCLRIHPISSIPFGLASFSLWKWQFWGPFRYGLSRGRMAMARWMRVWRMAARPGHRLDVLRSMAPVVATRVAWWISWRSISSMGPGSRFRAENLKVAKSPNPLWMEWIGSFSCKWKPQNVTGDFRCLGSWLFVLEAFSFSWTLRLERGRLSWRHTGLGHQNRPSQIMMFKGKKESWIDKMLTGTVMKNRGYPICIYVFSFIHPPTNPKNTSKYIEFKNMIWKKQNMRLSHIGLSETRVSQMHHHFALFGYP